MQWRTTRVLVALSCLVVLVCAEEANVKEFRWNVSDETLKDLERRLAATRYPDQIGDPWELGTDLAYLKEFVNYWRTDYLPRWEKKKKKKKKKGKIFPSLKHFFLFFFGLQMENDRKNCERHSSVHYSN
jgi:hypothetical protein